MLATWCLTPARRRATINCNVGCVLYSIEIIKAAVQVISTRSPTLTLESAFLSATREL